MLRFSSRMCLVANKKKPGKNEVHRGMATLKAISVRLKLVKNIQKITQSMKMVSAAKYARAERELKLVKTLGIGMKSFYDTAEVEIPDEKAEIPRKTLYIAMTSDRGLCGAVHSSIAKVIRTAVFEITENVKIICVGDKSRSLLQRLFGLNIMLVCSEVGRLPPTFGDASQIANRVMESDFRYDAAKIVYNRFRSVVSYVTEEINFYNVESILNSEKLKQYEDEDFDEETFLSFFEFSIAALIYYAMTESACSEQSSRMTAMDNASKNASEMIGQLTLTFNRTRQAVITRELIEIISGASALN